MTSALPEDNYYMCEIYEKIATCGRCNNGNFQKPPCFVSVLSVLHGSFGWALLSAIHFCHPAV